MKIISCFTVVFFLSISSLASASPALSGGVWFNYRSVTSSGPANQRDQETLGDVADEALVLYIDDAPEDKPWSFSGEVRFGPGSFTQPANNSTGDNFAVHKAWINYKLNEQQNVKIGKSQVPFGWKTVNFWPGDILLAGYGDQMDVGIKLSGTKDDLNYNVAYYHADDFGELSTDTMDDNGHWGSSTTYRKVKTLVGDMSFAVNEQLTAGASLQYGGLQDLTTAQQDVDGRHYAAVLYANSTFDDVSLKGQLIAVNRDLPDNYKATSGLPDEIKNTRLAAELGYKHEQWFWYIDASLAESNTSGNTSSTVHALAPGVSYNYGPGWMYVEYLSQNGFVNRDGQVGEGDFDALYLSIDYYF